jgi:hypothetical protein
MLPKIQLYYLAETYLKEQKIIINDELPENNFNQLNITDSMVYYDGLHILNIEKINFTIYGFFNLISINNIIINKAYKDIIPIRTIENISINWSILSFEEIQFTATGIFGTASGAFNINTGHIKVLLKPTKKFKKDKTILKYFISTEEGYVYEQ